MGLFNFFRKKDDNDSVYYGSSYNYENYNYESFNEDFLMVVEDVFTITGRGTVVTGTISSGTIKLNEAVKIYRNNFALKETVVVGIEMFRSLKEFANQGESVGLLLRGISSDDIKPGDVLRK